MQVITAEQLKAKIDAGEELHLIDVREPQENAEFNIGGILLPVGHIRNMDIDAIEALKEKEVICYCRSGNRSGQACLILDSLGFTNTWNLAGGMLDWQKKYKN
ncbi:rhodanese-like domain-containing protein [Agriterribacter sp.]|uniref:rhodanese-like domain-containing protein n=1 Tax=Agriterribacter sp. TaxID=2821509 RepID=UPI002C4E54F1|nr:rhodanese-like domain-containing protein [Agriterribacter sp.]HTN05110.1 rhodanese-like domain-containing protein [Agriterribacter sp.]